MKNALIGHTGFVGSNLNRQISFVDHFRSTNIAEIRGGSYDSIVCAGVQAKKWWANLHPDEDRAGIQILFDALSTVAADHFTLISTVDVYPTPAGVDETSPVDPTVNHAYGRHRFEVEEFVRERFPNHLILRLPGLFGDGIKKNMIHDLLTNHEIEKINPNGVYQYYFLDNLRTDIEKARALGLSLLNLSAEPISSREIVDRFFPGATTGPESEFSASYDMHSVHWKDWGSASPGYLYDSDAVLEGLEAFVRRWKAQEGVEGRGRDMNVDATRSSAP